MKRLRFLSLFFLFGLFAALVTLARPHSAFAATCSIGSDTLIDQAYVDTNSCTAIDIVANVSTTWLGVVDLGGGTVTVHAGSTMTLGRSSQVFLGATDDLVVQSGASINSTAQDPSGIRISARNVTIDGQMTASNLGCQIAEPFGGDGYGVNVSSGECEYRAGGFGTGGGGGGGGGRGGSHAGRSGGTSGGGAAGTVVYGDSVVPLFMGSGGGTGYYFSAFGGAGGGVIGVTSTGILTVNGSISADGQNGGYDGSYNGGGGGAGGSILIHANTLAGSGSIHANGGSGNHGGGGGSGGRVAVYYSALSGFSLSSVLASLGAGGIGGAFGDGLDGESGTVFILDRLVDDQHGALTINSGFDFPSGTSYARDQIVIGNGAYLRCQSATALTVSSTNWLVFDHVRWECSSDINHVTIGSLAGLSTTSTDFSFSAATTVTIAVPTWTNVSTTLQVTRSGSNTIFDIPSDLVLRNFTYTGSDQGIYSANGGYAIFPDAIGITMVSSTIDTNVSSTLAFLAIDTLSSWKAIGKGCRGGATYNDDGYGPDLTTGMCVQSTSGYGHPALGCCGGAGGGAAHGGSGAAGTVATVQNTTYDDESFPVLVGSGGGGGFGSSFPGSAGGGRIRLVVLGDLTVEGAMRADAADAVPYSGPWGGGGGGSGGTVNLSIAGNLDGSGSITAKGGAASSGGQPAGGGGGGRVAIAASRINFSGTSSTDGGFGAGGSGGVGSIYRLQLNQSPLTPTGLAPSSLVSGSSTSTNTPRFSFSVSDPDVSDTLQYRIQIDNNSDFSSPIVEYTSALGAQGSRSFQVGQALSGGTYTHGSSGQTLPDGSYYWRIQTVDPLAETSSYATANSGAIAFVIDTVARSIQFSVPSVSVSEPITTASVLLVLDTTHFEPVTVSYTVSGTASSGSDYTSLSSGVVTIPAGQTTTSIPFAIIDDGDREPNETIVLTLSSPTSAVLGANDTYTYTILDNDTPTAPAQTGGGASTGVPGSGGQGTGSPGHVGTLAPQEGSNPSSPGSSNPTPSSDDQPLPSSIPPAVRTELSQDARAFGVSLDERTALRLGQFLNEGSNDLTRRLGSGERRAMMRDLLDTLNRAPSIADLERLASGQIPLSRNLAEERLQLPRVRQTFRSMYGHDPNFQNPEENLAWNTLMYRIRFPRDLARERQGITEFRQLFQRTPEDPFQWAVVRVMGYVNN